MSQVQLSCGVIEGLRRDDGVTEYRGVPYAAAPLGALRFRAPQPVPAWQGMRRADRYPAAAWQEASAMLGEPIGDDCLALNIWVPDGDGPFPVMVWLHGGGYTSGSPSQLLYHGANLARSQNVIVVNVGYRLGVWGFGWFAHRIPDADSNLGLRDQIAALGWVQEHIAAFGGAADQVTLFGESAGGFSVATLLAVPSARSLFHRAVVQSGAADMVVSPEEAQRVTELVLAANPALLDDLEHAPAAEFVRAQRAAMKEPVARAMSDRVPQYGMPFLPAVDGELLPEPPLQAIARGVARDKWLLAGACRDEYHLFVYAPPYNGGKSMDALREVDDSSLQSRFERLLPQHHQQAWQLYSEHVDVDPARSRLDIFSAMESDRLFRVPTRRLLDAHAAAGGQSWGYLFTWPTTLMGVPLGTPHVVDVPFVFDNTESPLGRLFTGGGPGAAALAQQVASVWGGLARGEMPPWPAWQAGHDAPHYFGPDGNGEPLLRTAYEPLWQDALPPPTEESS